MKSKKSAPRRTVTKKAQSNNLSGFTLSLFFIVMFAAIVCIKYLRMF